MSTQRLIWTACPNGVAKDGKLRISVAIGPQLFASKAPGTLAQFPDFEDWPATKITWKARIGSHVVTAKVVSAAPSQALYKALFHATTPVDTYEYASPSANSMVSYPASFMHNFHLGTYQGLAHNIPEDGGLHSVTHLLHDSPLSQLPQNSRELNDIMQGVLDTLPEGGGPIPVDHTQNVPTAVGLATVFLTPPPPPAELGDGEVPAELPKPTVPKFDFHNAYSLLQRHPALLRLFGFVVDLEVPRPKGLPQTVGLSVTATWHPKLGAAKTTNVFPVTMTTSANWLAAPRPTDPEIADGLFRLSDKGKYDVLEMDVDGATFKTLNFVQAVSNAHGPRKSADTPTAYGAPALRSAGLSLSKIGHGDSMFQNWVNNDAFNGAVSATPPGPVTLFAEDIAQGYRVDVWERSRGRWFQLCARSAAPKPVGIGGYGIGKPRHVVPVPHGDEGWLEPVPTRTPRNDPFPLIYLPETLLRWAGWSLIASRPGKHLTDDSSGHLADQSGNAPPADAHFQLQIEYSATPGTLPTLRFGDGYRFRARVVDLAGNSIPFEPHGSFAHTTPQTVYGRFEPLASPVIIPCARRTPGESLERLVLRSNFDIPDDSPLIGPCERHLAPPAAAEEILETHGALDNAGGGPRKDAYALLAERDGLSYKAHSVLDQYGGKIEMLNAHNEWIYYPPGERHHPPLGVPYLPDVLSHGVALHGLPGAGSQRLLVPNSLGQWPNRRAVRLVVKAGGKHPSLPPAGVADGPITVYAPKASVTTVRLSSYFGANQLGSMKLWQLLESAGLGKPKLKDLIMAGGHYMFTPFRELVIVHAVRQPLTAPQVHQLASSRGQHATYTLLTGKLGANPPSTQRVDMLSVYTDPFDDGTSKQGSVPMTSKARVAEFPLDSHHSDVIDFTKLRQDFGDTKHHEVFYHLLATTRFAEYFTQTATVKLAGTTPVVVSHKGFAAGTVVVTGTGRHASTTYMAGKDFHENDAHGMITRIAKGSIANGAEVEVQFVAPPITRSSLESVARPPTSAGFRLSIPSSARPPAPDVRYLIPAFGWARKDLTKSKVSARHGNLLRAYLGRPWFDTGSGELLGVVIGAPPGGRHLPANLTPFATGYGSDPIFAEAPVHTTPKASDFKLAVHHGRGLMLAEHAGGLPWFDVVGHEVSFDPDRKLWFSDIEVDLGGSYFPFVKLALVRYQPSSLPGVEISRVVQADFIQVAPDRTLTLTFPADNKVRVVVTGPGYLATSNTGTDDTMRAYVQEQLVKTSDENLRWQNVSPNGTALKLTVKSASFFSWEGTLTLPTPRSARKYRIYVAESEQHKVVHAGDDRARVTYLDAIEI